MHGLDPRSKAKSRRIDFFEAGDITVSKVDKCTAERHID